ncbi:Similar to DNA polymerase gamma, mitochondrial; acc. no. Q9Y767 [Pyronema omphalodes CBS 100304]|uniref:DNA-directed DNA polymerase n=1 Tax=Pyronema omphalodes (strain CBS 100304) TaxID=1076935 RepID=U4L5R9_PYROM|nr:Similar to DNA polymerase gamma, mitochondrial; acc. no. Q9Y767 [Pyronema omphalodes CBS 100304]
MLSSLRASRRVVESRSSHLSSRLSGAVRRPCTAPYFRRYASEIATERPASLMIPDEQRRNEIGVQQLPAYVRNQLFKSDPPKADEELLKLAERHLAQHELLGKISDKSPPIAFDLPPLRGQTLDEHFNRLGQEAADPYLSIATKFAAATLPDRPHEWIRRPGWTKYVHGEDPVEVEYPDEEMLVFDVEVLYKESPFAIMACAASPKAWYAWLSPWLLGESESDRHLIPLGDPNKPRIVAGHNIGYDRARIKDEYNLTQTKNFFIDTMSLHVAVNGMCSQQRPTWLKHAKRKAAREMAENEGTSQELTELLQFSQMDEEEDLWVGRSSINSLRDVAKFHCNITIDKAVRDYFGTLDREGIMEKLDMLLNYCAADVAVSHKVYRAILPKFLHDVCPHPVSFAALRHLSSVILPVNETWNDYINTAEKTYQDLSEGVSQRLKELVNKALESCGLHAYDPEKSQVPPEANDSWRDDPFLRQLDWEITPVRMTKETKKAPSRPVANQKLPGYPKWYKDLYPKSSGPMNLTVRTRIAPLLLRLCWDGKPLIWSEKHGWVFRVEPDEAKNYEGTPVVRVDMSEEEKDFSLRDDTWHCYYKIPHKDGPQARCTAPLAKSYMQYFESGILSSEYPLAKEALDMNAQCSYWISARERIRSQMVIYEKDAKLGLTAPEGKPRLGVILPQLIPMGTITRRAVESTWLTASNAKKNRVGSELKAMVKAPEGYVLVGADVDSEELWIASLVGDAQFKLHGAGALGFMTLEGTKNAGTDLHSKTANILGISRNNAKVFNYGRIYGAGVKFASTLLRQFNPKINEQDSIRTAEDLYRHTKGAKHQFRKMKDVKDFPARTFWYGGTESLVFNKLEEFAEQDQPRTPVLGAKITEALQQRYMNKGGFLTSRINWAIQSSGVDYLHLLIISMDYLIRLYGLNARLAITVHDEIRYLVKDQDKYKVAMALQVANVWTRAMFSQQMGIEDLPQSCAWFSAVDIDSVLRKEVDLPCITPSHPNPIPSGESVDIIQLLEKGDNARLDETQGTPIPVERYNYKPRVPIMEQMNKKDKRLERWMLEAQISSAKELEDLTKKIIKELKPAGERKVKKERVASNKQQKLTPYGQDMFFSEFEATRDWPRLPYSKPKPAAAFDWATTKQWTGSTPKKADYQKRSNPRKW